jgi:hypothetical protein
MVDSIRRRIARAISIASIARRFFFLYKEFTNTMTDSEVFPVDRKKLT